MNHPSTEFPIISLTREDLEAAGFDSRTVDDGMMTRLAGKMADEFVGEFLSTLEMLAQRHDIPKRISSDESASDEAFGQVPDMGAETLSA